jgi:diguanylate cyclase (GGDEF)-like protein/putative nucleotidyltransferase with HDIG domain
VSSQKPRPRDVLRGAASDRPGTSPRALARENRKLIARLGELEAEQRELRELALRDPLTGLLNRCALKERLGNELRQAERTGAPVAIVALDIDFFKHVNDAWGHEAGDELLRGVADHLSTGLRPGDVCGRVGGDEFILGLVGADAGLAVDVAHRLRDAVALIEGVSGVTTPTLSLGVAEFPRDGVELDELIAVADQAMYRVKAAGGDGCSVHGEGARLLIPLDPNAGSAHEHALQHAVRALARAVDLRSGSTHLHSHTVATYAAALAKASGFDRGRVDQIRTAAVLHDVGKIGVPDEILRKPDALTPEERAVVQSHSVLGRDILTGAGLPEIGRWVAHLHERADGGGYPDGLTLEQIPPESRILKVADALDAMTCRRVYRESLGPAEALEELRRGAGTEFDGVLAERLVELVEGGRLDVRGGG